MTAVRRESMELTDTRLLLNRLRVAAQSDGASPKSFALLLRKVLAERAWEKEGFASFRAFMEAPEPIGLHMTADRLLDAARLADIESLAKQLLDGVRLKKNGEAGRGRESFDNIKANPGGDSESYLRRRLKRDAPDLYRAVSEGTMTAHSAAIRAGMRHRNISVRIDDPRSAERTLRKHMTPEALARLIELLTKED